MTRDEVLVAAFDLAVESQKTPSAVQYRSSGCLFRACQTGVLYGPDTGGSIQEETPFRYKEYTPIRKPSPSNLSIQFLSVGDKTPLLDWGEDITFIPVSATGPKPPGIWAVRENDGDEAEFVRLYPYTQYALSQPTPGISRWGFPVWLMEGVGESGIGIAEFKPVLFTQRTTKPSPSLYIGMYGETETLWAVLAHADDEGPVIRMEDGRGYRPDGWQSDAKVFKQIKEIRKMAKVQLKRDELLEPPEPEAVAAPEVVNVPEPAKDVPAVQTAAQSPVPAPNTDVQEDIEQAVEQEAQAEKPAVREEEQKARRPKQEMPMGFDFSKVQAYLGSAVPPQVAWEKAIEELRSLRELQIGTARRMFNLSTKLLEGYKNDADLMQSIKGMLNK